MYAVCVTFKIQSGMIGEFMLLMQQQAQNSLLLEVDCHRFDVCTNPEKPDEVFLYEIYSDAVAFQVHLASDHFKQFDADVRSMLAEKTVHTYQQVYPYWLANK